MSAPTSSVRGRFLQLYDLDADPGELNSVAGRAEYRDIQQTLTAAMQDKMITYYDFIPPVMTGAGPRTYALLVF